MPCKKTFTKENTLFIKGMGIIVLLVHHLFFHGVEIPISLPIDSKIVVTTLTKVCVPLFTVMSGYGISKSWSNSNFGYFKFTIKHIKKLLINYWIVFLPAFILSTWLHIDGNPYDIYGGGLAGIINFALDFLGLRTVPRPTLCNTWWYMEAIIVCYLLFPLIDIGIKHIPCITVLICALPCLIANIFDVSKVLGSTDREMFYIMPFAVGVLLSNHKSLDRIVDSFSESKKKVIYFGVIIGITLISCILALLIQLIGMLLWALALILLFTIVKELIPNKVQSIVLYIGKHSMNIFLIHSFIYCYFSVFANIVWRFDNAIWIYGSCFGISLLASICIDNVKKKVFYSH